ncbi:hypothetical protein [Dysgonomonas sp. ZJ279]|uniref:hypothetical protein n=1 Tax=Dysgonomonas sp. ZJ279 TaxID=2709796 RepID=UPI0013EBBA6A|nr:hypothetical protein [Dysgonomonas sp. ZJ279]
MQLLQLKAERGIYYNFEAYKHPGYFIDSSFYIRHTPSKKESTKENFFDKYTSSIIKQQRVT